MDNKQNDWVLETLQNPDFTYNDFINNSIDANNTSMYDRDKYLNSPLIQSLPLFLTDGQFDKVKFNSFYDYAKDSYQSLALQTYVKSDNTKEAIFSYNNLAVSPESRSNKIDFKIEKINNPNRLKIGIEEIGFVSNATKTPLELAQEEKIFDPETNTWEESPNDSWLFRNWFEPVAMATYDYDVDANGNPTNIESEIVHRKGEYKINPETGTYYYEKLNGRSPYGKDLLSPFDVITRDGSVANQYDFFDSDSIDKSFTGSVMKTVARVAPMLIPGFGEFYIAANIATELGKALPIIYKSTFGLGSSDNSFLNTIEAVSTSFSANRVSQKGQESFFSSENIANLIGDVAKLLYEQRWLFSKAPRLFKKYGITKGPKNTPSALDKEIEKRALAYKQLYMTDTKMLENLNMSTVDETRAINFLETNRILGEEAAAKATIWSERYLKAYQELGRNISRMYMSTTASYLAYQDAKEEGASDMEAAMVFWGYLAGEYAIISSELGEHVLPELRADKIEIRNMLEKIAESKAGAKITKKVIGVGADKIDLAKGLKKIFLRASDLALKTFAKGLKPVTVGGGKLFANALGEGIEEVSEEVLYDVTRVTFDIILLLRGEDFKLKVFDNWAARYGLAFFGGALGGALFEGINNIENRRLYNPGVEAANQQLIYHVRNGRADEIRKALAKMRDDHIFGNTNLSNEPVAIKDGEEGKELVFGEGTPGDNLNEDVYKVMMAYVDNIELTLSKENMLIPDIKLMSSDNIDDKDILQLIRYLYLMNSPTTGNMLQDFNDMGDSFLTLHKLLADLEAITDPAKRLPTWEDEVKEVQRLLKELREKRKNFFSAETQAEYIGQMMQASNPIFSRPFANITFRDFAETNFHKKLETLSEYELTLAKKDYEEYLKFQAKDAMKRGYSTFMNLNRTLSSFITLLSKTGYKKYIDIRNALLDVQIPVLTSDGTQDVDEDGNPLTISIMDYITSFGTENMTEEEIMKRALELKNLDNPFEEVAAVLLQNNPLNSKKITIESKIKFALNLLATLHGISDDLVLDSSTANVINALVKQLRSLDVGVDVFSAVDSLVGSLGKEVISLYKLYRKNTNISNIEKNTEQLIKDLDNIQIEDPKKLKKLTSFKEDLIEIATNSKYIKDSKPLEAELAKLDPILQNTVINPISELLKALKITSLGNRTIFDIIELASNIFKQKDIRDFILDGEISIQDIKDARLILKEIEACIRAAQSDNIDATNPFGFNPTMNLILKSKGLEGALAEISGEMAAVMIKDLYAFDRKLSFIEQLHDINREATLKELSRVGVNLNYLSFDVIGKLDSPLYKVVENGELVDRKINGDPLITPEIVSLINGSFTIKEYIETLDKLVDISDLETLIKMAKELNAIEEALYARIHELIKKYGLEEVLKLLIPGFVTIEGLTENSHQENNITYSGVTSDTHFFTDQEKLAYLASIIAIKPLDFEYLYTQAITNDTTRLVPIPMQKFAVRVLYGGLIDPLLYNLIVKASGIKKYGVIPTDNITYITGIPGAGKTSACARLAMSMFKLGHPDINAWCCGPEKIHASNLKNSVDIERARELNLKELLDYLGTTEEEINGLEAITIGTQENGKVEVSLKERTFALTEIPDVILVDEYTQYTAAELMLVSQFAKKYNIPVLGFGDPDQNGRTKYWKLGDKNLPNKSSICFGISSPKLTVSMRVCNTNKRDNLQLSKSLAELYNLESFKRNPNLSTESLWAKLKEPDPTKLFKYTIAKNGAIYGDYIADPSEYIQDEEFDIDVIKLLIPTLEKDEKIGIVYDSENSPIYKAVSELKPNELEHIELINSTALYNEIQVLGNECLYFIVDINWGAKITDTSKPSEYIDFMKSLNTITSRSKWGSIILDNGLTDIIGIDKTREIPENSVYFVDDFKNDTVLNTYKNNLINILNALIDGYVYSPVSTSADGGASGKNGNPTGITEVLTSDFDPSKIDFTKNIIVALKGGEKPLQLIVKNRSYRFRDVDPDDFVVNNAKELLEAIDDYVEEGKNLVIAVIPKSEYDNASSLGDFLESKGNSSKLDIRYIKYILLYTPEAPESKVFVYKFKEGTTYQYKGINYEITKTSNGYYYIKNLTTNHISIIPLEDFEKNATPLTIEEIKGEARIEGGLKENLEETKKHSTEEIQNLIELAENDELGLLVYTNFGYRSGIALEKDQTGKPIIVSDAGQDCYKVISFGHEEMNKSDLHALLKLSSEYSEDSDINIPISHYEAAKKLLANIRSLVKDSTDNTSVQIANLINNFWLLIGKNDSTIDPSKLKIQLRVLRKWDENIDEIFNTSNPDIENHRLIVLTLLDNKGISYDITLGTLQSSGAIVGRKGDKKPTGYLHSITKQMKSSNIPQEDIDKVEETLKFLAHFLDYLETHTLERNKNVNYFPLGDETMNANSKLTNVTLRYVTPEGNLKKDDLTLPTQLFTYSALRNSNKNIIVSPPYILTGKFKNDTTLRAVRNGSAICFVTEDLNFTFKGVKATNNPHILATAYKHACLTGDYKLLQKIKVLTLTPLGISFKDYMLSVIDNKNSLLKKKDVDIVMPYGNINTSSRLLRQFLLMDAELTDFINSGNSTENYSINGDTKIKFESIEEAIEVKKLLDAFLARTVSIIEYWQEYLDRAPSLPEGKKDAATFFEVFKNLNIILERANELVELFKDSSIIAGTFDKLVKDYLPRESVSPLDSWEIDGNYNTFANHRTFHIATAFNDFFSTKNNTSGEYEFKQLGDSVLLLLWLSDNLPIFSHTTGNVHLDSNFPKDIYFKPLYLKNLDGNYDVKREAEEMFYPAEEKDFMDYTINVDPQTGTHLLSINAVHLLLELLKYTPPTTVNAKYKPGDLFNIKLVIHGLTAKKKDGERLAVITEVYPSSYKIKIVNKKEDGTYEIEKISYNIPLSIFEGGKTYKGKSSSIRMISLNTDDEFDYIKELRKKYSSKGEEEEKKKKEEREKKKKEKYSDEELNDFILVNFIDLIKNSSTATPKLKESISSLGDSFLNRLKIYITDYFLENEKRPNNIYPILDKLIDDLNVLFTGKSLELRLLYPINYVVDQKADGRDDWRLGTLEDFIRFKLESNSTFSSPIIKSVSALSNGMLVFGVEEGNRCYKVEININSSTNPKRIGDPEVTFMETKKADPVTGSEIDLDLINFVNTIRNKLSDNTNTEKINEWLNGGRGEAKLRRQELFDSFNTILTPGHFEIKMLHLKAFEFLIEALGMKELYEAILNKNVTLSDQTGSCFINLKI